MAQDRALVAPALSDLAAAQRAFERVVADVAPSVVGIRTQRRFTPAACLSHDLAATAPPGSDAIINGTGCVLAEAGLVLTNEHVVQWASMIEVLLHDGQRLPATLVAADARSDLAVLRVARSDLKPVRFAAADTVSRGQWVVLLGNPYGLGSDGQLSVSVGVVANLGRQLPGLGEIDDRLYCNMIQVTAPIHPGNSGGPLFNLAGEVIGIITAMHTRGPSDEGIGFAIPITPFKERVIRTLASGQTMAYGYVGMTARPPTAAERDACGGRLTAVVQKLEWGGPAAEAGLRVGDRIVAYDGVAVSGPGQLAELVGQTAVGARVALRVLRDGGGRDGASAQALEMEVVVGKREATRVSWLRGDSVVWRGMRLANLGEELRRRLPVGDALSGIVVVDVEADSPAARAGLRIGDVIELVETRPVPSVLEFISLLREVEGPVEVLVRESGRRRIEAPSDER